MDVRRTGIAERRRRSRWLAAAAAAVLLVAVTVAVASLDPAVPTVDRGTVWLGAVERGRMERVVRGHGTLVPEQLRWVQAPSAGRVEAIRVEPGNLVDPEAVIFELANPEIEQAAVDAANALRRAAAELESLRVTQLSSVLDQQARAAEVDAEYTRADLLARANRELAGQGLVSEIQLRSAEAVAQALATRQQIEARRLAMTDEANRAMLAAKQAEVEQVRARDRLRAGQLAALAVRAGIAGTVQEVAVEIGQQVSTGTMLAKVADATRLEAELRVPAAAARNVRPGQDVKVDTRNGVAAGRVSRVDPAVQEGTVLVEVRFDEPLPDGARPDLPVDGSIRIEELADVLHVGRPARSHEGATVGLYRLEADGVHATRVTVRLGSASADSIQVVDGLAEGDRIILSDTSEWHDAERIALRR